jgi:hypothetical protein
MSRGNIVVLHAVGTDAGGELRYAPIYLYTHWEGEALPHMLADALTSAPDRWTDAPYLTRIIFSVMTRGAQDSPRGFAISPDEQDNEVDYLVVNPVKGTIHQVPACFSGNMTDGPKAPPTWRSFTDFIERESAGKVQVSRNG